MSKQISEKGKIALHQIKEFFPKGRFSAADLSNACGIRFVASTLKSLAGEDYLVMFDTSPLTFETSDDFESKFDEFINPVQGCDNTALVKAKIAKDDEFYTPYKDIEAEVMKYKDYFADKVVYLPCDDPVRNNEAFIFSEFWSFFVNNFNEFKLKKLIATHYSSNDKDPAYKIYIERAEGEYMTEDDAIQEDLKGNGDFRSAECLQIMRECDIVCTNPPFSLFREFLGQIISCNKDFLIVGNENAYTYKEVFPLFKNNKVWTGYNKIKRFLRPDNTYKDFGNVCWFTNIPNNKRNEELVLIKSYYETPYSYPTYDNYKAIEVDRCKNIPYDYDGVMGVPITFLSIYNPNQFTILGHTSSSDLSEEVEALRTDPDHRNRGRIKGKEKYDRVLIVRN